MMNTTSRVAATHPNLVTASLRRVSARYGQVLLLQGDRGVSTLPDKADSRNNSRHLPAAAAGDATRSAAAAGTATTRSIGTKKKDIGVKANEEEMRPGDRSQVQNTNSRYVPSIFFLTEYLYELFI